MAEEAPSVIRLFRYMFDSLSPSRTDERHLFIDVVVGLRRTLSLI